MKKKLLLLFIIALPSLLWIILETSTINSYRLNVFGPKTPAGKDTLYYSVPDRLPVLGEKDSVATLKQIDTLDYRVYVMMFISPRYKAEGYRIAGVWEYFNYKTSKVAEIPFFFAMPVIYGTSPVAQDLQKLQEHKNITFLQIPQLQFDSLNRVYFSEKPYYVDHSFLVLVDSKRNIRGYYDARYAAEVKRLIDEHQHLRLKEEKQKLLQQNEIKAKQ